MSIKKGVILAIVFTVVVAAAGILVNTFLLGGSGYQAGNIVLPQQGDLDIDFSDDLRTHNQNVLKEVTVDRENVIDVIQTLFRPQEYSYKAEAAVISDEGRRTLSTSGYISFNHAKIILAFEGDAPAQHTVLTEDRVFIWAEGSQVYYEGSRGEFSSDDIGMIPTYEDIVKLDNFTVIEGSFLIDEDGQSLIFAKVLNANTGMVEKYYVSVENGLLIRSETEQDEKTVYQMHITELELKSPDGSNYMLPSGVSAIE